MTRTFEDPRRPAVVHLRHYQADAISRVDDAVANGVRRVLLVAATGSGKTTIAGFMILRAIERGERVVFLAHRRELILQAYRRLLDLGLSTDQVGVIMGNDPRRRPGAPVQVASVDTLRRRARPAADVVFYDEAHRSLSATQRALAAGWPDALHIGLTATPYGPDGAGMGAAYDELVVVASPKQLIAEGFLVAPRVFTVPALQRPDLKGVRVARGDYAQAELEAALDRQALVGNIVEHWKRLADGVRTVVFAVSIAHSRHITDRFIEAGVAAEHLDGETPTVERDAILARLDRGDTRVVSNVGVLCLDSETEILTSAGFIGIDGMTNDHEVAGWSDGAITFERPLEIMRRARLPGERMVSARGKSVDLRITEGHGVVYRSAARCVWKKRPARERVGSALTIPAFGHASPLPIVLPALNWLAGRRLRKAINHTKWNVQHLEGRAPEEARVEAIWRVFRRMTLEHKSPADLTLDECRFIGFWLGDGSITELARGGVEYKIFESSHSDRIVAWLDGIVASLDVDFIKRELPPHERSAEVKYRRTAPCFAWSFPRGTGGGVQAREGLYAIEKYLVREGSDLCWGLDVDQFRALLHGFWMADGNHGVGALEPPKSMIIHNARRALLDRVQAIAACRGYRTRLAPTGKPGMWRLSLIEGKHFSLGPGVVKFEPSWGDERVWCVRTRAGNIVTRRNGVVVVLGNCEGWDQPSVKCAILARPTKSTGLYLQQAGRILRPWNDQPAIILDHAGCALEHGLPQDDRVFSLEGKKKRGGVSLEAPTRVCPDCAAVVAVTTRVCPECGKQLLATRDAPVEAPGDLVETSEDDVRRHAFDMLCAEATARGFKPGWAFHRYRDQYGVAPPIHWKPRPIAFDSSTLPPPRNARWLEALRNAARAGPRTVAWSAIDAHADEVSP